MNQDRLGDRGTRRDFFSRIGDGLHGAALAALLQQDLFASSDVGHMAPRFDLKLRSPHFEPRAKSVIHLFMNGGPSQVDLFDPKPTLERMAGAAAPRDLLNQIENMEQAGTLMPSPYKFFQHGKCGMDVSELLPHTAKIVDEITLLRSMYSEHFNHEPALNLFHTGRLLSGRPALGAWVTYALGTENQNLPGYVVLDDKKLPINGIQNWQAGWLPPVFQGTRFREKHPAVLNLTPKDRLPNPLVEAERSLLRKLDETHRRKRPGQPDLDARISSYELAARMQLEATDALDLSQESEATKEMYGLNNDTTASYGRRCLMARRLVERGVRFVQIFIEAQIWDNHSDLKKNLEYCCAKTDQPSAALVQDLKQRGLLGDTLVVWGGEFGRMPISQVRAGANVGRDHGPDGFSMWMAGGGVKAGHIYGATDDIGHKATEDRVSVHDFHATLLHQMGLDHRKLVYHRHGLEERLTDQYPARVVEEILS